MLGVDLGHGPDMTAIQSGYETQLQGIFAWETIGVVTNRQWYPYGCVAVEEEFDECDDEDQGD